MTVEQAEASKINPFDVTKVWPHGDYPLIPVGRMVLNRNPSNYFAEVEQIAFAPSHLIPGVEASPDKMLQGRLFSYADTHRHRLGANYLQIPVNCPFKSIYISEIINFSLKFGLINEFYCFNNKKKLVIIKEMDHRQSMIIKPERLTISLTHLMVPFMIRLI